MRWLPFALLLIVAVEIWRLTHDETVRLRQTWDFDTPSGPAIVEDIVEVRRGPSVPYLPGGAHGPARQSGRLPVSFDLDGRRYFISSSPWFWLTFATSRGLVSPPVSLDPADTHSQGFVRRLRKAGARIVIPVSALPAGDRRLIRIGSGGQEWGEVTGEVKKLDEFEAAHPGFKLKRITYVVID